MRMPGHGWQGRGGYGGEAARAGRMGPRPNSRLLIDVVAWLSYSKNTSFLFSDLVCVYTGAVRRFRQETGTLIPYELQPARLHTYCTGIFGMVVEVCQAQAQQRSMSQQRSGKSMG
eukprot:3774456-Pleurochrysis_carterae.AAC.1